MAADESNYDGRIALLMNNGLYPFVSNVVELIDFWPDKGSLVVESIPLFQVTLSFEAGLTLVF